MQVITINNDVIRWEKQTEDEIDFIRNFKKINIIVADENSIHLTLERISDGSINTYMFIINDTQVNGKLFDSVEDLFNAF